MQGAKNITITISWQVITGTTYTSGYACCYQH
jgi:hypothetical protein